MLRQLSPVMENDLRKHFPELFREIRTVALLRFVNGVTSMKMIQPVFPDSLLSDLSEDLAVSESSVRKFITEPGSIQDRIDAFMRDSVMPRISLLFDGWNLHLHQVGRFPVGQRIQFKSQPEFAGQDFVCFRQKLAPACVLSVLHRRQKSLQKLH